MAKNKTDMVPQEETSLARPSYIPRSNVGREHFTRDDILMPRLLIAQAMSPQLKVTDVRYIDDLKQGDMFNSLTGDIIQGPVDFHVVRAERPRGVEFYPRDSGGGVKDPDVPLNDPRMQFTTDKDTHQSVPPIATKFYDFVIIQHPLRLGPGDNPMDTMIALSFKNSGIKVARLLNGLIEAGGADVWAQRFRLTVGPEKNAKGEYFNFVVKRAGWASQDEFNALKALHETLSTKNVVIEREPGDDTETLASDM